MNWEFVGTTASIIILIGFTLKGEQRIRAVNVIGAALFALYGFAIKSFSVWFLNAALIVVHAIRIYKDQMNDG